MQVLKLPKHASKNVSFLQKKLLITSNKTDQLKFIIIPNHAHIKQYIKSMNRKGFHSGAVMLCRVNLPAAAGVSEHRCSRVHGLGLQLLHLLQQRLLHGAPRAAKQNPSETDR